MEGRVVQSATALQNAPSQMSSTTVFQITPVPNTSPTAPEESPTSVKSMECDIVESDTANDQAPVSNGVSIPSVSTPTASTPSASSPSASSPSASTPLASTPSKSTPLLSTPSKSTPSAATASTSIPAAASIAEPPKASPSKSKSKSRHKKTISQAPMNKIELELRVEVYGYPAYSRPQDFEKVLSNYGPPTVEHVGRNYAVVAFPSEEMVQTALTDSAQLLLYGQFLNLKPFSGFYDDQKRQVYKSKHTVITVKPEQIVLEGSFGEQLSAVLAAVRLTQEEVTALAVLYGDLERVMQPMWPGCQAMPFGSITTGLGVKSSDADCFMSIPPQFRYGSYNFVNKAKRILQQYPKIFSEVFAIPRANTPIVKLFHLPTRTHCDLTFKTPLGALNSKLVAFLLHSDPRLLPLAVIVKYWASVHGLSGSGKLTNYALTLLLIFYLQVRGLLPSVATLQCSAHPMIVDGWNTGFVADYKRMPRAEDEASIEELLGEFFKYYDTFDFESLVVCPFIGQPIEQQHFVESTLSDEFKRYMENVADNLVAPLRTRVPICVQDPFEQCHNVASSVTPRLAEDIRCYIHHAAELYEKEKSNSCNEFLRGLLLTKPKLIRAKTNPEYRMNLSPRLLDTIAHDDWRETIKTVVFTIFEHMLQLKLVPNTEAEKKGKSMKDKEKYLTSMTKPLWKRKKFTRLYELMRMSFMDRQARITEEIVTVEHSEWTVEMQVTMSFLTKVRGLWLTIRLAKGNLDAFHTFGKFFVANWQNWAVRVLHAKGDTIKENLGQLESLEPLDSTMVNSDGDSDNNHDDAMTNDKPSPLEDAPDSVQGSEKAPMDTKDATQVVPKGVGDNTEGEVSASEQ